MNSENSVLIYVKLLEEGTPTVRGTQAIPLGDGNYKLLPTPHYDPIDEIWEFLPGSVVRCRMIKSADGEDLLTAFVKIG